MNSSLQLENDALVTDSLSPSDADGLDSALLNENSSLEIVLAAWNDATTRLQETHEVLQVEVGRLAKELEAKNHELARENRLADLGRMASHVAHEVRNSLVPVTLYMGLLKRRLSDDSGSRDILAKVEAGFTALDVTVNDLLNFSSHREPHWNNFSVRELVDEVCLCGPRSRIAERLAVWKEAGVSTVLCATNDRATLGVMASIAVGL